MLFPYGMLLLIIIAIMICGGRFVNLYLYCEISITQTLLLIFLTLTACLINIEFMMAGIIIHIGGGLLYFLLLCILLYGCGYFRFGIKAAGASIAMMIIFGCVEFVPYMSDYLLMQILPYAAAPLSAIVLLFIARDYNYAMQAVINGYLLCQPVLLLMQGSGDVSLGSLPMLDNALLTAAVYFLFYYASCSIKCRIRQDIC